jgi:hypothetical protein
MVRAVWKAAGKMRGLPCGKAAGQAVGKSKDVIYDLARRFAGGGPGCRTARITERTGNRSFSATCIPYGQRKEPRVAVDGVLKMAWTGGA